MSRPLRIAALVSVLLHAALALVVLVPSWQTPASEPDAPDQLAQVELLTVEKAGSGKETAATAETADTPTEQPEPSPPIAEAEATPLPPPVVPVPQSTEPAKLIFNIGGTDSESSAIAMGDQITPASIDDRARNRPPVYPPDAARRGQKGAVLVLIHVSPDGLAFGADVLQSSGFLALDRAARDAVLVWRFVPAVKNGVPVPFDIPFRIVFDNNQER